MNFHYEIGIYEINYPDLGVIQIKKLVSHYQYKKDPSVFHKPDSHYLYEIDVLDILPILNVKQYFTDKSPLYRAIETGVLECNNYKFKCELKLIRLP